MASDQQIQANRANAQKSTGPTTPEGKAACSLNALKHGFYARSLVLPFENQTEFDNLCDQQQNHWQPEGQAEIDLVEELIASKWTKIRMTKFAHTLDRLGLDPVQELTQSDRLDRFINRVQNRYLRALKELRSLQRDRLRRQPTPDEDPAENPKAGYYRGLAWTGEDGKPEMVVPPQICDENGVWHDVPRSEWPLDDDGSPIRKFGEPPPGKTGET